MESATENSKSILKYGSSSEEKSMLLDDPESKVKCKSGDPITYDDAPSIYKSDLTQEDKSAALRTLLINRCNPSELKRQTATTPLEPKRVKVEDPKGKADDGTSNFPNHEKQKKNDESPSRSPQQQSKSNKGGDPVINDDVSSTRKTDLTCQDKKTALQSIVFDEGISSGLTHKTATIPPEVKQVEIQHSKDKTGDVSDKLLNKDGKEKKNGDSPSCHSPPQAAKENVAPEPELELKEISSVTEKEIASSEEAKSSASLQILPVAHQEADRSMHSKALSQTGSIKSNTILQGNEVFTVKEVNGINSDVRIHRQEAVCRQCFKLMSEDSDVLKAECKCTGPSLVHQECAKENMHCSHCEEQIKNTSATLSIGSLSTMPLLPKEQNRKTPNRPWWSCFN